SSIAGARAILLHLVASPLTAWAFMEGQLEFMRRAGFRVVLAASPGEMLEEVGRREGVEVFATPIEREPSPGRDSASLVRLWRLFRRIRPHMVHAGTPKAGLLGMLAARLAGVPVRIFSLHGLRSEGLTGTTKGRIVAAGERLSCRLAHRVVCVSESLKRRAEEIRIAPSSRMTVPGAGNANGVNAGRFTRTPEVEARASILRDRLGLPPGVPTIGFVGRLVRDKGIVELAAAFNIIRDEFPEARLLLVGRYEEGDPVPEAVREKLASDPSVLHAGFVKDAPAAYALMDVLVLPTYREGFPTAPLEAAAMELPVVATRVTGCVDAVVDGVTGTLVPPRDAGALAGAIRMYLRDPELRRRHGRAGRERVLREFRPERIWRALLAEYVSLLEEKGIPVPPRARLVLCETKEPEEGGA
ncbi:MAG: glycosyltransferase family 4 protein, partial [Planctomycetota bacterium]|nr:glycosyltransferase family 4 protein [Planctomycetota bacterium]